MAYIDHARLAEYRIALVRDWRAKKKVRMTIDNVRRCARELGLSSATVKDCLTAMESRKRKAQSAT